MKDKLGSVCKRVGGNVREGFVRGEITGKITQNIQVYQSLEMTPLQIHIYVIREVNGLKISKCGSNLKKIKIFNVLY